MKSIVFVIIGLLINVSIALSCSCRPFESEYPIDELNLRSLTHSRHNAKAIFYGKLIEYRELKDKAVFELKFKVNRVYKGEISDTINVYTARSTAACGLYYHGFRKSKDWVIYAYQKNEEYWTGLCTRSFRINSGRYSNKYKRFLDIVYEKREGQFEFYKDEINKIGLVVKLGFEGEERHGGWMFKNEAGEIIEEGSYDKGKKVGDWKEVFYNRNSIKKTLFRTYENGEFVAGYFVRQQYYPETKQVKREETRHLNKESKGTFTFEIKEYDRNGILTLETTEERNGDY